MAGSSDHRIRVETVSEKLIRESEEERNRIQKRLEEIPLYEPSEVPDPTEIWRHDGLTPPPTQE
jgi:hypothetical protein